MRSMARANRLSGYGGVFLVTHRCHNREFLLKFALDREGYRARLREHWPQFEVALLDYCITSNHVHLRLDAQERMKISGWMRMVAGEFARADNRRKKRTNAYWGDNFHATLVEGGSYLWRCLCYIELNRVRWGRVGHPRHKRGKSFGCSRKALRLTAGKRGRNLRLNRVFNAIEMANKHSRNDLFWRQETPTSQASHLLLGPFCF